ncbi:hypothetical protein A3C28_05845 [Candidatus Roizmanbacteria bacterium RIFCSPHIGHO2_02_FULL_39_9]|uniref:DUF4012 domain-containing protein n=1 Tax=Candidatus Roizmanbacteria bacterium RIFCSPHIGHO2_02_FULL_39_9 TaxID=1802040 RepID=A0A1F7HBI8_9BACT|nr:MAG: hypothetical protein A3C28_05845 [Candidatus Roizmanbacteria bacterium RIFCSPHIGHO2_02_FULL_39_9]
MSFITETISDKNTILLVSEGNQELVQLFREVVKKYKIEFYLSPRIPPHLEKFDYCFFINQKHLPKDVGKKMKKICLVYVNSPDEADKKSKQLSHMPVKIINLKGQYFSDEHIEKILWFSFSDAKEPFLTIIGKAGRKPKSLSRRSYFTFPTKKRFFLYTLFFLIVAHIIFIPFLAISSYFFYKGVQSVSVHNPEELKINLDLGLPFFNMSKKLYSFSRTTYLIFSISLTDDIMAVNEKTYDALSRTLSLQQNGKQIISLLLDKNKSSQDYNSLELRVNKFKNDIHEITSDISTVNQKIPHAFKSTKDKLNTASRLLSQIKELLPHLDYLLAKNTSRSYLILFANNMELRPGGGFIGSFGVVTMNNYTFEGMKIYDVYDADGQLAAHVDPPVPLRIHLGQPNWFLRDSAFSPDFLENYQLASFFLEKEMGMKDFSGGILLTTTAIQNILGAFGEIYLPDFKEKVNKNNFYLKAQIYSESGFFPGSTQKKNFLGDIAQYLLLNLDNVNTQTLAIELKKSLDEKQIVIFFDNEKLQDRVNRLYWSGKVIQASCPANEPMCISDYLFSVDANLGVNKANFFVSRSYNLDIELDDEGNIRNILSIQFKNDSQENVFPGGTYKNYYQLFLPPEVTLETMTKDGTLIENYDNKVNIYQEIGILLEVKPKTLTNLKIVYTRKKAVKKGTNVYQLILQKQIGSSNSDFSLRISVPSSTKIVSQNFPVLVKDNFMIYNTSLSQDKIFFIELVKE